MKELVAWSLIGLVLGLVLARIERGRGIDSVSDGRSLSRVRGEPHFSGSVNSHHRSYQQRSLPPSHTYLGPERRRIRR